MEGRPSLIALDLHCSRFVTLEERESGSFPGAREKEAALAGVTCASLGQLLWPEERGPAIDQTWVRGP